MIGMQPNATSTWDLFATAPEAQRTQDELLRARTKLGVFLDLIPVGLVIHQRHAIIFANLEAGNVIGIPPHELIGHHILDFVDLEDSELIRDRFNRCFDDALTVRALEARLTSTDGQKREVQLSMSPLFWDGLPVINIVFSDITLLKKKEHELFILSTTDSLTGAYNRRYFMDAAAREFKQFQRHHTPLSLMVMDIDYFKRINDNFGHAVGDEAIKAFVDASLSNLRREDVLGRMGGEEFAVLLPQTKLESATAIAERLRRQVASLVIDAKGGQARFTVSIGVTQATASDISIETGLNRADRALYEAKATGRNRVMAEP